MLRIVVSLMIGAIGCGKTDLSDVETKRREEVRAQLAATKRGSLLIAIGQDDKEHVWAVVRNNGGEQISIQRELGAMTELIFPNPLPPAYIRGVCGKPQLPDPLQCAEMFLRQ